LWPARRLPGASTLVISGRACENRRYYYQISMLMKILETERLILRRLSPETDAEFILELVNDPSFIRFIGDKGVRTLDEARNYILNGPVASYEKFGFGLYAVELKEQRIPIGMCGVLKRDTLPHPDIGFAFLPAYWNQGYAFESAAAVMRYAREVLRLNQVLAITTPENEASAKLLDKIGLRFEKLTKLTDDADEVKLFAS
jgi:RimJ/RimL family protein N-acetyltransferase